MSEHLIQCAELERHLGSDEYAVIDCRFALAAPTAGATAYLEAHVPGAVYADLERDLSGPPVTDHGRHPMPPPQRLEKLFGRLGISNQTRVVVYDDSYGMVAARLWWMLRFMGHAHVQVLDGGWQAWTGAGLPVVAGEGGRPPATFRGRPNVSRLVLVDDLQATIRNGVDNVVLLDAREAPRFRGESEPIDAVAGHIAGAANHCWRENLDRSGKFLPAATLRAQLSAAAGQLPDAATTHYCGSGVSACHNVLAQCVAGLPEPRLYCGSWSEWCRDPGRQGMMATDSAT